MCWLLARSPRLVPIPGAQTIDQAIENAAALDHGPLTTDEMTAIDAALANLHPHNTAQNDADPDR